MILVKPFKFTRTLRIKLQSDLSFKLKINDSLRQYAKNPTNQSVTYDELLNFLNSTHKIKRLKIPDNMLYNQHVKDYWLLNPKGSHLQCVASWNSSKTKLKPDSN